MNFNFFKKNIEENKYGAELDFWKRELKNYIDWYNGKIIIHDTPNPLPNQKVKVYSEQDSAILTWFELHQKPKYIKDLELSVNSFKGMKLLDLGSGPFPNSLIFQDCDVYSLDPLFPKYIELGYPTFYYENRAKFVKSFSENMPFENNYFDAIISVNAIDHVDDFEKTALEIKRVLKPGGLLRLHVHYHKPTKTEPLEIDDTRFISAFSWVENLKKVSQSHEKMGHVLEDLSESYVVWSNF